MFNYEQNCNQNFNGPPDYSFVGYDGYQKQYEKAKLRKASRGLGFFITAYFLCMVVSSMFVIFAVALLTRDYNSALSDFVGDSPLKYYYNVFVSVFSAFIPALFYLLISGNRLGDCIIWDRVKISVLLPVIFIGLAAAMLANQAAYLVQSNFSYFGLYNSTSYSESSSSLYMNILYVISTAIVPAFAEEFAFRGILMGSLRKYGDMFAIVASSVLFGAMHGNITQIPFAFILGLIFAYVDCKTNSLLPSVCIHFLNNLYAVIMDIISTEQLISDYCYYVLSYGIIALMCLLGIISFILLNKRDGKFFSLSERPQVSLSFKEKSTTFFTSSGVIICLSLFAAETVLNLL